MTIDVTDAPAPVCAAPSYGDRREIWTGTVTVGQFELFQAVTGYGFSTADTVGSLSPSLSFSIGSNNYVIGSFAVALSGNLYFSLDGMKQWTDRENFALHLHVCDADYTTSTLPLLSRIEPTPAGTQASTGRTRW